MNGKALKNKFGEALYKNELMFDKIMNKRMDKVNEEVTRYSQIFDSANLVFLNRVRQKRNKWIQEDKRYREYYKMVCTNVHKKKLNKLGQSVDPEYLPQLNDDIQYKFVLLDQHLKTKKVSQVQFPSIIIPPPKLPKEVSFYEPEFKETTDVKSNENDQLNDENKNETSNNQENNQKLFKYNDMLFNYNYPIQKKNQFFDDDIIYTDVATNDTNKIQPDSYNIDRVENTNVNLKTTIQSSKISNIPKLPKIKSGIYNIPNAREIEEEFDLLYSKFSECDNEFLEKLPAKVEIMDTNIGKRFIFDKKQKSQSLKRQKQKFSKIQSTALDDLRFQNLMSFLQK